MKTLTKIVRRLRRRGYDRHGPIDELAYARATGDWEGV